MRGAHQLTDRRGPGQIAYLAAHRLLKEKCEGTTVYDPTSQKLKTSGVNEEERFQSVRTFGYVDST